MDRQQLIDSLHWREYTFVGQGNAIFEGILTQESEEQIADQILALIPDIELPRNLAGATVAITDKDIVWYQKIEEAKKQERERIIDFLEKHKVTEGGYYDKGGVLTILLCILKTDWQALKSS